MRLIQLNAWSGRLDYALTSFLEASKADLVCLQEAIELKGGEAGLFFMSIEDMQDALGAKYLAFGPTLSFNFMQRTADFGNAIISRLPIQKSEVIFIHQQHQPNFDFIAHKPNMRNLVHAVIDIHGQPCNFITHHGYWIHEHKDGNEETMRQMKLLADYIDGLSGPIVLTGDFNLKPHSESLEQINSRLTNLSIKYQLKTTRNSLTTKTEVCDYIFVNDQVRVKEFYAAEELMSDHKALVLDFDI